MVTSTAHTQPVLVTDFVLKDLVSVKKGGKELTAQLWIKMLYNACQIAQDTEHLMLILRLAHATRVGLVMTALKVIDIYVLIY